MSDNDTNGLPPFWQKVNVGLDLMRVLGALAAMALLLMDVALPLLPPELMQRARIFVLAVMVAEQIARAGLLTDVRRHLVANAAVLGGALVFALVDASRGAAGGGKGLLPSLVHGYIYATLAFYAVLLVRRRPSGGVMIVVLAGGALGLAAAAVQHGFRSPPTAPWRIEALQLLAAGLLAAERLMRLAQAPDRAAWLRSHWTDLALMVAAVLGAAVATAMLPAGEFARPMLAVQLYILFAMLSLAADADVPALLSRACPAALLAGTYLAMVLAGWGLLMLPAAIAPGRDAHPNYPIFPADALVTAANASCVTGLTVKDIGQDFSLFGQVVILVLMQAGGLVLMLVGAVFAARLSRGLLGPRGEKPLTPRDDADLWGATAKAVLVTAGAVEAAAALLMMPMFLDLPAAAGTQPLSFGEAAWYSVFHSVSAFCNAGLSLYTRNLASGIGQDGWAGPMRDHWQVLGVIAPLIVIGGLGMPVLSDLWRFARQWIARLARASQPSPQQRKGADPRPQLSLHSRVVLSTTLLAVLAGAAGLLVLETQRRQVTGQVIGRHAIGGEAQITADWQVMDRPSRLGAAVFQSVSARSGGFSTIDCAELGDGGKLWLCGIMSIGGSPAGTAGGMRTTTLALLVFAMFAAFARRDEVRGFQQPVAMTLVIRAVGMAMAYFCFVLAVTLALSVTLRDIPMVDLLFTASSACGNVGLSTGIASHLDDASKFIITAAMYIGRVGPLMVLMYMAARPAGQRPGDADVILA